MSDADNKSAEPDSNCDAQCVSSDDCHSPNKDDSHLNHAISPTPGCESCINYDMELSRVEESERGLKEQLAAAKQLADRYENELSGERVFRKELEDNFRSLGAEMEKRVNRFQTEHRTLSDKLSAMENKHKLCYDKMVRELTNAAGTCTRLENDFMVMQKRYEHLLGLRKQKAEELRNEEIDLPQTVEELQFLSLQLKEDLIDERAAKEHQLAETMNESIILQQQLRDFQTERSRVEAAMSSRIESQTKEILVLQEKVNLAMAERREMQDRQRMQRSYQQRIEELEGSVTALQKERQNTERTLAEFRQKCHTLQTELDTCETVQKDFVRLSQSLQIQLEKIRQAEQEVRWQFDEDVFDCNGCETNFGPKVTKLHCHHCGKIFCVNCLSQSIPSGPNHRLAKVCEVCHTLLNRDSAPFFSKSGDDS